MTTVETTKLDELFRRLPNNTGIDPRLVEDAKTELNVLKGRAEANAGTHKHRVWSKSDSERLNEKLFEKEAEIKLLRRQLRDGGKLGSAMSGLDKDRGVAIKGRYMDMYDTEWSEAYDYFKERGWTEVEIIVTLQRILRASYSLCRDVAKEQLENIEGEACVPAASWMDDDGILNRLNRRQISKHIADIAKLYQKSTAQECLPALQKAFSEEVLPTFIDPTQFKATTLDKFSSSCVEICWYMVVQDPPMLFVDKYERGSEFNPSIFRKYTKQGGNKFDYLVWPALQLHEEGPILVKGVAKTIPYRGEQTFGTSNIVGSRDGLRSERPQLSRELPSRIIEETDVESARQVQTPRSEKLANGTPPTLYKKAPDRDSIPTPQSPYFDSHVSRTKVSPGTSYPAKVGTPRTLGTKTTSPYLGQSTSNILNDRTSVH